MSKRQAAAAPTAFVAATAFAIMLVQPSPAIAERVETGLIMTGTPCETGYWIKQGENPGPKVFVIGGPHGDEIAGYLAADKLVEWEITAGALVLLPRAHQMAIKKNQRGYPGNMNNMFPGDPNGDLMHQLAYSIWQLVEEQHPDLLVTLHESIGFHSREPNRYGQTLTYDFHELDPIMQAALDRVNPDISNERDKFMLFVKPFENCPTYQAWHKLGIPATSIETCRQLPLALRIRYQLMMVMGFFDEYGLRYQQKHVPPLSTASSQVPRTPPKPATTISDEVQNHPRLPGTQVGQGMSESAGIVADHDLSLPDAAATQRSLPSPPPPSASEGGHRAGELAAPVPTPWLLWVVLGIATVGVAVSLWVFVCTASYERRRNERPR